MTKKQDEVLDEPVHIPSHKEYLLELYKTLQDLNIRSISDLENQIAQAE